MDPMLPEIYQNAKANPYNLLDNQYLIVTDDGKPKDVMKWQNGECVNVHAKSVRSDIHGIIKPKNVQQKCLMDALFDPLSTVKTITGQYGSGKTFLGLVAAFEMIKDGRFDKLVWIRNNIEVKDSNPIGYLKGSYMDKMAVWAGPLIDFLGGMEEMEAYIERNQIEIEHLGFLRGRSFKNSVVFCTEAEHLTRQHVQLLLGRIAEGSILILEGDTRQIDAKAFEADNGLEAVITRLKGHHLFSYVHLDESVRSETAKLADLLDKE